MARPQKNTVDYFPHLIGSGKKMQYIEMKYGNDGYATWFKLLETLAITEHHFLNMNEDIEVMFLSAKCRVSVDILLAIIEDLVTLKVFDKTLWQKRVLWSQMFINHIQDAYKRRENKCLQFEGLCMHLQSLGIHIANNNALNSNNNTQSKVKEIKVKEIKYIPTQSGEENDPEKPEKKPAWEQYSPTDFETPKQDILNDQEFVNRVASDNAISVDKAKDWIENFFQNISFTGESKTSLQGYRKHCKNWISLKIQNQSKNYNNGKKATHQAGQRTSGTAPAGGYSGL
ncbi:DUF4373 domain-containing protein [Sphingobacterium siyangense]|uniref:DUF4373 domain-containing protein n=1 Tax=Sphingobacterium siyangense TaxID=459529 RepID=UPI003DA60F58